MLHLTVSSLSACLEVKSYFNSNISVQVCVFNTSITYATPFWLRIHTACDRCSLYLLCTSVCSHKCISKCCKLTRSNRLRGRRNLNINLSRCCKHITVTVTCGKHSSKLHSKSCQRPSNIQQHIIVDMRFIYTRIFSSKQETMLLKVVLHC